MAAPELAEPSSARPDVTGRAWADPDSARVSRLIEESRDKGWRRALAELAPSAPFFAKRMENLGLGNWHMLLLRDRSDRALDIGCGFGSLPLGLAHYFRTTIGTEFLADRLAYASLRAAEDARHGCRFVRSNGHALPFSRGSLDLVTMNGVLEWAGLYGEGDPRELQLAMLREVRRVLAPRGNIAVAIENRMALESILGLPDTHSGVIWATVLPRPLAEALTQFVKGMPLRTRLYTPQGYRRLMGEAGYGSVRILDLISSYNDYDFIVDVGDKASYQFLFRQRGVKPFFSLAGQVRDYVAPRFPGLASRVGYANLVIAGEQTTTIIDQDHPLWDAVRSAGGMTGTARFACQGRAPGQVALVAHDGELVQCVVELSLDDGWSEAPVLAPRLQELLLRDVRPTGHFIMAGVHGRVHTRPREGQA